MRSWLKITGVVSLTGLVLYAGTMESVAGRDDGPEIVGDSVMLHAGLNADGLDGVIEGSVSFMVNVPFQSILENFQKPGTLGQLGGDRIEDYTVAKEDAGDYLVYRTVQKIKPFKAPLLPEMDPSVVGVDYFVNKRALNEGVIFVKFELNKENPGKWERFQGRIYVADLHNGNSMCLITSSTKSQYNIPLASVRMKLVKKVLEKTKDNILSWLDSI